MDDRFLALSRIAFRRLHGLDVESVSSDDTISSELFFLARRNRVAGLWADAFSPDEDSALHRQAYGQAMHSARFAAEAERIFSALNCSVKNLRLVKGPALSAQAWPRPGLRSFDDLDFRCEKNDLPVLLTGLRNLGYEVESPERFRTENLWHFGWGISFRNADGVLLEFNHRMFPPHYPWPLRNSDDLWFLLMLDQTAVACPVPALHLLISCVHAVWHGWERLGWLADIAGLLTRHHEIFAGAARLAGNNRFLSGALRCGCAVADRIFGPLPGMIPVETVSSNQIDQVIDLILRDEPAVPAHIQREIHQKFMSPFQSALYTVRRFAIPGDPDFKRWPLPGPLCGLYWPLRPMRYLSERLCDGSEPF